MLVHQGERFIHRRTALLLGVLLVGVLVFAACSSSSTKAPAAATKPATEATKAAPAAAAAGVTETVTTTNSVAAPAVALHEDAKLGKILVDATGMTLYVFDKDSKDTSACSGECLAKWPALTVADESAKPVAGEGVTGALGVITRDDGKYQVTINGMPLYTYASDTKAGDTTGQAVGDVWWVVGADGAKITAQ